MIRDELARKIADVLKNLVSDGALPDVDFGTIDIVDTKNPEHGDFACNVAMTASKKTGRSPREIGELIKSRLSTDSSFDSIDVAGPGFLNLRLAPRFISSYISFVIDKGLALSKTNSDNPLRVNIEFVSVNPNGPITVGSGRGAAFGDALARVMKATGHVVHKEYYINDGVNSEQMRLFAESVKALALARPVPSNGYKGDYVQEVAEGLLQGWLLGKSLDEIRATSTLEFQRESEKLMLERQKQDLEDFGVVFDTWFSEQSLHDSGQVEIDLEELIRKCVADEDPYRTKIVKKKGEPDRIIKETQSSDLEEEDDDASGHGNTLWLRSTKFGDDQDRVLRRKDGRLTYISSDVSYHKDKFKRPENADKLLTILGPDHHGYIHRLVAVLAALLREGPDTPENNERALATAKQKLEVIIFQIVRFVKNGQHAPMRKRDGNIYSLRDLMEEIGRTAAPKSPRVEQVRIGRDVSRFFYLMRSHDTHMDFDIDLATKQSDENPVFYVQYAHARICSILRKAEEFEPNMDMAGLLTDPRELALIKKICDLPHEVRRCAEDYGVHRLTTFAMELGRSFHHFYDGCRVIQPEQPDLTRARLALCQAALIGLRSVFEMLGISAPERMDREEVSV